jgi:integrase
MHAFYVLAVTTGMREAEMLGLTWEDVDLGNQDRSDGHGGGHRPEDGAAGRAGGDAPRPSASVSVRHTLQRVEGQWQLRPPKTDKSRRTIPLTPVAVSALKAHRKRQMEERMAAGKPGDNGLVFTTTTGRPIHGSNLLPEFRAHLARLGLPKVTLHDVRHSCATVLFGMGVPLEVISDMLGHSTTRVTADLYRHRLPALEVGAAAKMQEAMGG